VLAHVSAGAGGKESPPVHSRTAADLIDKFKDDFKDTLTETDFGQLHHLLNSGSYLQAGWVGLALRAIESWGRLRFDEQ
jgi:hypothetical protein